MMIADDYEKQKQQIIQMIKKHFSTFMKFYQTNVKVFNSQRLFNVNFLINFQDISYVLHNRVI